MYKKALKIKLYLAWCFQDRKKENAPKFSSIKKEMAVLYRESDSMIKEQQGPTLGARFREVSVLYKFK